MAGQIKGGRRPTAGGHRTPARRLRPPSPDYGDDPGGRFSVLIADPDRMVAEAIAAALRTRRHASVVTTHPGTGREAIAAVERHRPDLVFVEYVLDDMKAPRAVRQILAQVPGTTVIGLSSLPDGPHVTDTLNAGAAGFLAKASSLEELVACVQRAQGGQSPLSEEAMTELEVRAGRGSCKEPEVCLASLAPREREVLRLIGRGMHVDQISRQLKLKESTVRGYVRSMLHKTNTRSQVEVVALAREHGVIY